MTLKWKARPIRAADLEVRLALQSLRRLADRWSVIVELSITNGTGERLDLDKATVFFDGELENAVFEVRSGKGEVAYLGMMRKRGPPGRDGFVHLRPGETFTRSIDLGPSYAFPEAGKVAIAFDSFNHFSKDAVQLTSNRLELELVP